MLVNTLLGIFLSISFTCATRNNVCTRFEDYEHADTSANCFYNPDMLLETPDLVIKYAGTLQRYEITTEDGYILTMFRIPRRNAKASVLLQHPLTQNSKIWVALGPDSFAFYLWRAGYDIWLNNDRGTTFSEKHRNLSINDPCYWNWSFHEIGKYDVDSQVKLIRDKTNNAKLFFIGQSMGTTVGLIYSSLRPQEAKNSITAFIYIATTATFKHHSSPTIIVAVFEDVLRFLVKYLRLGRVLIFWPILTQIVRFSVRLIPRLLSAFNLVACSIVGWTPDEADPTLLNFDSINMIKDFSWKILLHYLQLIRDRDQFQMFDYGKIRNLKMYHSEKPPLYPLEAISVPTYLISSFNDSQTTAQDAEELLQRLSPEARGKHLIVKGLNHIGYFLGQHKKDLYYEWILNVLNELSTKR